jgi:hypothetical protein
LTARPNRWTGKQMLRWIKINQIMAFIEMGRLLFLRTVCFEIHNFAFRFNKNDKVFRVSAIAILVFWNASSTKVRTMISLRSLIREDVTVPFPLTEPECFSPSLKEDIALFSAANCLARDCDNDLAWKCAWHGLVNAEPSSSQLSLFAHGE